MHLAVVNKKAVSPARTGEKANDRSHCVICWRRSWLIQCSHALGVPPPVVVDPVFIGINFVLMPVHPAVAFEALEVACVSVPRCPALIPVPLVVACLLDPAVTIALCPSGELVAADPPVIRPVIVEIWGVPPTAVISAVVGLVVGPGALLPDPFAVARLPIVLGNAGLSGNSADSEKRK